jgi:hypothetical protein
MKRITSIVAASLFAVLIGTGVFSSGANAQTEPAQVFSVPFPFTADGHVIDAGTYEINRASNQFLMSIRNLQTGEQQLFAVRPEQQRTISSRGVLVFHRCGSTRDLTEFHVPGTNLYSTVIPPRRSAASDLERCSEGDTTTIAAR